MDVVYQNSTNTKFNLEESGTGKHAFFLEEKK